MSQASPNASALHCCKLPAHNTNLHFKQLASKLGVTTGAASWKCLYKLRSCCEYTFQSGATQRCGYTAKTAQECALWSVSPLLAQHMCDCVCAPAEPQAAAKSGGVARWWRNKFSSKKTRKSTPSYTSLQVAHNLILAHDNAEDNQMLPNTSGDCATIQCSVCS